MGDFFFTGVRWSADLGRAVLGRAVLERVVLRVLGLAGGLVGTTGRGEEEESHLYHA